VLRQILNPALNLFFEEMSFKERFEAGVEKFNLRVKADSQVQEALKLYAGRSITLKVTDDTIYVFYLERDGVRLEVSPDKIPDDMYLETSKEILQRMIDEKKLNPADLLLG
jgi:hypothetical protein